MEKKKCVKFLLRYKIKKPLKQAVRGVRVANLYTCLSAFNWKLKKELAPITFFAGLKAQRGLLRLSSGLTL
jgi:hypothetical protein